MIVIVLWTTATTADEILSDISHNVFGKHCYLDQN